MFPIDAIKHATVFALYADDYFAYLDMKLDETPYRSLRNDITNELVYYYLYHHSVVPELNISYLDLCLRLIQLINSEVSILLFESEDELHSIIKPLLNELDILFASVALNPWGMYLVQINNDYLEISYVGDYRIIQWSESDAATKYKGVVPARQLLVESPHSFRQK